MASLPYVYSRQKAVTITREIMDGNDNVLAHSIYKYTSLEKAIENIRTMFLFDKMMCESMPTMFDEYIDNGTSYLITTGNINFPERFRKIEVSINNIEQYRNEIFKLED